MRVDVVHVAGDAGGGVEGGGDHEAVVEANAEEERAEGAALLGADDAVDLLAVDGENTLSPAEDEGGACAVECVCRSCRVPVH